MYQSSLDNMEACIRRHILPDKKLSQRSPLKVLDVGGEDINGSYSPLFASLKKRSILCDYVVTEIAPGSRLGVVQTDPYKLPFHDDSFDVVISGQTFEHSRLFWLLFKEMAWVCPPEGVLIVFLWLLFKEMARVCSPEGVVIVINRSTGPIHRFPVERYRFLPDAYQALARYAGLDLVDTWIDERGPFHNLVGVFRSKEWQPSALGKQLPIMEEQKAFPAHPDSSCEVIFGAEDYIQFLERIHGIFEPRFYLEIGVYKGDSLRLAKCPAIGIDPSPLVNSDSSLRDKVDIATSDEYFFEERHGPYEGVLDLAYIDGMHLVENALKDFINIEAMSHPGTIIVLDDIYPNHPKQALRERETGVWTGDVWKMVRILRDIRPDLVLIPVDTLPAGTLIVLGADSRNQLLTKGFDLILDNWRKPVEPPPDVLQRKGALHPKDPGIVQILSLMKAIRYHADSPEDIEPVKIFYEDSLPRKIVDIL